MNKTLKKLDGMMNALNESDVIVCFDLFDTILSRKTSPEEVKKTWAKLCSRDLFPEYKACDLYKMRTQVENRLYRSRDVGFGLEYTEMLRELFHELDTGLLNGVTEEVLISFSIQREIEIEMKNHELNHDIAEVIKYCQTKNAKMVVVSDFYFGEEYIYRFLEPFELARTFEKIFVSCDLKKSKHDGDIYNFVSASYPGKDFIMIGDNYKSDYFNAQKNGFRAIHVENKKAIKRYSKVDQNVVKFTCDSINRIYHSGSYLSNYVFALYLFTVQLYIKAKKNGAGRLLFLSRDGELLKILFDTYQSSMPVKERIDTKYFLISRNAAYIAGCSEMLSSTTFDELFTKYKRISLEDFLKSLSFSEEQTNAVLCSLKKPGVSSSEPMTPEDLMCCLFDDDTFIDIYHKVRINAIQALTLYLSKENLSLGKLFLVDVGWKGTIQDSIWKMLQGKSRVTGYYYGLTDGSLFEDNKKNGIMFSGNNTENIFFFDHWFMENILTGSHRKVAGYEIIDGKIVVRYEKDSDSVLYDLLIKQVRKEIIEKFERLTELFSIVSCSEMDDAIYNSIALLHYKTTRFQPFCQIKMNYVIRNLHSEGFGNYKNITDSSGKNAFGYYIREYGIKYLISSLLDYIQLKKCFESKAFFVK